MKKALLPIVIIVVFLMNTTIGFSQREKLSILNVDTHGLNMTPEQMGNLLRIETEKLDSFEVMDQYDVRYLVEKNDLLIDNCYGKICLVETGKIIGAEKMLSGTVDLYGETIIITLRLIDVNAEKIERSFVREFLNLPKEIQSMIMITLNDLFYKKNDALLLARLTKKVQFESEITNPNKSRLNLSGPRLGATYFTGDAADYMAKPLYEGGYDAIPVMFMFGYQFEVQYVNSGRFQALFEFIPTITGLDQGIVMPNISILNGLRDNVGGWEFALGPTIGLIKKADGYYDSNNIWHLSGDWILPEPNPYPIENKADSRGTVAFNTGFLFAAGRSFKSGKINIPVNAFVIPSSSGIRFGLTFGYNAKGSGK